MKITVKTKNEYDILIERGILEQVPLEIYNRFGAKKLLVVSDNIVFTLYGEAVINKLAENGFCVNSFVFANGEKSKNAATYLNILNALAEHGFNRDDIVIALGGGVVGDVAGFAAATYMRGIRYLQIPTTLLAMVDSSVGGKTAIDLQDGKNLAGAFWQPALVLCDSDALKTLPEPQIKNGIAEVIKYGFICDKTVLDNLTVNDGLIAHCIKIKQSITERDERDNGIRQILNFGHTFGHTIEKLSDFTVPHGFAVSVGMAVMLRAFGLREYVRILKSNGLPVECDYGAAEMLENIMLDKKVEDNRVRLIVVKEIGKAEQVSMSFDEVKAVLERGLRYD